MNKMRNGFERFCFKHRNWGIPNLMLYLSIGSALVYLFSMVKQDWILYDYLCFDYNKILQGQVWRLFSYAITFFNNNPFMMLIGLICYYSLGRAMENAWGTFRFNLFYLTGIVMMDAYAMITGAFLGEYGFLMSQFVDITYLNMSLFLGYATLYPDTHFLLFFIIPVRAWIFGLVDLVLVIYELIAYPFPFNLFSVIALANYFLFFGKDVVNLLPMSWRVNVARLFRKKPKKAKQTGTIPFPNAGSYQATTATVKAPYTHRCTVCGRTDVSNPELEFRYCSRCNGYHCYCEEHIANHQHIE